MKKWTKKQFKEIVTPCGYRIRIWLFFLTHRYVTLLDVVDAKNVSAFYKVSIIYGLDRELYKKFSTEWTYAEDLRNIRAELLKESSKNES